MERRFHVVFTGRLHAGFKHAETVERMVELFQLDKEKVTKLLFSGRPTIIKRELVARRRQVCLFSMSGVCGIYPGRNGDDNDYFAHMLHHVLRLVR